MRFTSLLKKLLVENARLEFLYNNLLLPTEKALKKDSKAKPVIT